MEKFTVTNEMVGKLKRCGLKAGDIALSAAMTQIGDRATAQIAIGAGIMQGLKYRGNFKRGIKAGLVTYGVIAGTNAIMNVASNWDVIKKQ